MVEAWFLQDFWTESGMFKSFIFFTYFSTQMKFLTALHRFLIISCYLFLSLFIPFRLFPSSTSQQLTTSETEKLWQTLVLFIWKIRLGEMLKAGGAKACISSLRNGATGGDCEGKLRRKWGENRSKLGAEHDGNGKMWEQQVDIFSSYILFFSGDQHPRSISSFLLSPPLFFPLLLLLLLWAESGAPRQLFIFTENFIWKCCSLAVNREYEHCSFESANDLNQFYFSHFF